VKLLILLLSAVILSGCRVDDLNIGLYGQVVHQSPTPAAKQ
jgi:hypothetical protein